MEVHKNGFPSWHLTRFYGFLEWDRRKEYGISFVIFLILPSSMVHFIFWDFNDLMSTNEKIGNKEQSNFLSQGFQDEISYNGLHDLPMEGYNYT